MGVQIRKLPVPQGLEPDDLRQLGICGLIKAVEKYDPDKGSKFEAYASWKIRGAVLDQLRIHGQVTRGTSRTMVEKARRIEGATSRLEQRLLRQPTSSEIAAEMGSSLEDYFKVLSEVGASGSVSLDALVGNDDNLPVSSVIKHEGVEDPSDAYLRSERLQAIERSIDSLPEQLKSIITLYYHREFTFKEIGELIGLTQARISQMHTEAILRIRAKILTD